ncbi:MAG: o-succinylbenzoate--CoA ligase [Candidatus Omnitrophica bacterium]|nr:o-succinylbenzoate--CoA ligase [Candidatus Omnitrophota bacterium]
MIQLKKISCPIAVCNSRTPCAIALISKSRTLTYRQLHEQIQSTQSDLINKGVRRGTKVAITSANSPEYVVLLFALWRIGAVACLLSPRIPALQIKKQIRQLGCSTIISPKEIASSLPLLATGKNMGLSLFLDAPATIMLTSGSSGNPKAVVHSVGNHYYNAKGSNENIPVVKGDRWLLSLPLYHVSGLSIIWRCVLGGGTIVFEQHSGITHMSLVTTQLRRFLKRKANIKILKSLKAILLGGGPIPQELIKTITTLKLPVFLTYGLTEMTSQVATSHKTPQGKIKTLKYRHIKISKTNEILVKGKTLFKGYLQNGKVAKAVNREGWFPTGDVGEINQKTGLRILGRKDNMFISGGENIYPEEIEKAFLNCGGIDEAIIVPVKNREFGFRPVAFVRFKNNKRIAMQNLIPKLTATLPNFKIPDQIYEFPREYSPNGIKVNRQLLIKLLS